jgi:hypothetical protein
MKGHTQAKNQTIDDNVGTQRLDTHKPPKLKIRLKTSTARPPPPTPPPSTTKTSATIIKPPATKIDTKVSHAVNSDGVHSNKYKDNNKTRRDNFQGNYNNIALTKVE